MTAGFLAVEFLGASLGILLQLYILFPKDVNDIHNVPFSELFFGSLDSNNVASSGLQECLHGD